MRRAISYPTVFIKRGEVHAEQRDYDAAVADFDTAIRICAYERYDDAEHLIPGWPDVQTTGAAEFVAEHAQTYASAHVQRGAVQEKRGKKREAIKDYRRALEIQPDNSLAAEALKRLGAAE